MRRPLLDLLRDESPVSCADDGLNMCRYQRVLTHSESKMHPSWPNKAHNLSTRACTWHRVHVNVFQRLPRHVKGQYVAAAHSVTFIEEGWRTQPHALRGVKAPELGAADP